jgi:hypothetical protein
MFQGSNMKRIISALFLITAVGCASISTGVDTVKNVVATAVDTGVTAAADISTAIATDVVETGQFVVETSVDVGTAVVGTGVGVVQTAAKRIDEETNEIEVEIEKPDFPTGKLKED